MSEEIRISSEDSDSGVIKFDQEAGKVVGEKDITPWLSNGTRSIKDSLLRFHN